MCVQNYGHFLPFLPHNTNNVHTYARRHTHTGPLFMQTQFHNEHLQAPSLHIL